MFPQLRMTTRNASVSKLKSDMILHYRPGMQLNGIGVTASRIHTAASLCASIAPGGILLVLWAYSTFPAQHRVCYGRQTVTSTEFAEESCQSISSILRRGSKDNVPASQTWSHCQFCRLRALPDSQTSLGRPWMLDIFTSNQDDNNGLSCGAEFARTNNTSSLLLSRSRWHGFFHHATEEVHAHTRSQLPLWTTNQQSETCCYPPESCPQEHTCGHIVERPTFIIPLLTWHFGHLLVDVLEPLYHMLLEQYGEVNRDIDLYIEVSRREEREVLAHKLKEVKADTPFALLQLFSNQPIGTVDQLSEKARQAGPHGLCFRSLQLGIDLRHTYTSFGYDWVDVPGAELTHEYQQLRERYRSFQAFLWYHLSFDENDMQQAPIREQVTLIKRQGSRRLRNLEDVHFSIMREMSTVWCKQHDELKTPKAATKDESDTCPPTPVSIVALEDLNFSQQLQLLHNNTTILVAQYGTAAHNVIFLRPGSVLVLLMQPGWCDWSWVYTLQARLVGVHTLVYCPEETTASDKDRRWRWATRAWLQGPWYSKDLDYSVDPYAVQMVLRAIPQIRAKQHLASEPSYSVHKLGFKEAATEETGMRPGTEAPKIPATRAHLTLSEVMQTDAGRMKFRIVPEIIVADAARQPPRSFAWLENRFLMCAQVFPLPADLSSEGEDAFNEFSTLDLELRRDAEDRAVGSPFSCYQYVLHGWLREKSTGDDVPDSDTFLPIGFKDYNTTCRRLLPGVFEPEMTMQIQIIGGEKVELLSFRLDSSTSLAADIMSHCRSLFAAWAQSIEATQNCALLAAAAHQQAYNEQEAVLAALPGLQRRPSARSPFIFYHLEKAGGSSLRRHLASAAVQLQLPFFIPCYDETARMDPSYTSCHRWNVRDTIPEQVAREKLAVVAGHFQWNVRDELSPNMDQASKRVSCVMVLRDPVDRIISFYYERLAPLIDHRRLNNLSHEELSFYLQHFYGSAHAKFRDEGMSNAACKLLCNGHSQHGYDPLTGKPPKPAPALNISLATSRLSQCVVGLQGHGSESRLMFSHWFPWIDFSPRLDHIRENVGDWKAERPPEVRADLKELIEHHNQCDIALYLYAQRLFARQRIVMAAEGM